MEILKSKMKAPWTPNPDFKEWSFAGADERSTSERCKNQAIDLCGSSGDEDDVEILGADTTSQEHDHNFGFGSQRGVFKGHVSGSEGSYNSQASRMKRGHAANGHTQGNDSWDAKRRKFQHTGEAQSSISPRISQASNANQIRGSKFANSAAANGATQHASTDVLCGTVIVSSASQPYAPPLTQGKDSSGPSNQRPSSSLGHIKKEPRESTAPFPPEYGAKLNSATSSQGGSRSMPIFLEDSDSEGDHDVDVFAPLPTLKSGMVHSYASRPMFKQPTAEEKLAQKVESDRIREENIAKKRVVHASGEAKSVPNVGRKPSQVAETSTGATEAVHRNTPPAPTNRPSPIHISSNVPFRRTAIPPGRGSMTQKHTSRSFANSAVAHKPQAASVSSLLRTIDDSNRVLPTSFGASGSPDPAKAASDPRQHVANINKSQPRGTSISSPSSHVPPKHYPPQREPQTQCPVETPPQGVLAQHSQTNRVGDEQAAARLRQQAAAQARAEYDARREREAADRDASKRRRELWAVQEAEEQRAAAHAAVNGRLKAQEKEAEEVQSRSSSFAALMSVAAQKSETGLDAQSRREEISRAKPSLSDYQRALHAAGESSQVSPRDRAVADRANRIKAAQERNSRRRQAEEEAARRPKAASPGVVEEPLFKQLPRDTCISGTQPLDEQSTSSVARTGPVSLNSEEGQARLSHPKQLRLSRATVGTSTVVTPEDLWFLEQHNSGIPYSALIEPCAEFYGQRRDTRWLSRRKRAIEDAIVTAGASKDLVDRVKFSNPEARKELHTFLGLDIIHMPQSACGSLAQSTNLTNTVAKEIRCAAPNTCASDKSDLEPLNGEEPSSPGRQTWSGKSLGGAALAYYAKVLAESWEEEHQKSEINPEFQNFLNREPSPMAREDYHYWVYQIVRREISRDAIDAGEDIGDLPWEICNQDFEDRDAANHAAHLEGARFLQPENTECTIFTSSNITNHYDRDGMAITRLEVENGGIVEARVVRYSRTVEEGVPPSSKEAWAPKTIYYVMQQVVVEEAGDGMFEGSSKTDMTSIVEDSSFTDHEMANEWAARHFVKSTFRPTNTHLNRRDEEIRAEVERLVAALRTDTGELFDQRLPREGASFMRVWVRRERLRGPRN